MDSPYAANDRKEETAFAVTKWLFLNSSGPLIGKAATDRVDRIPNLV